MQFHRGQMFGLKSEICITPWTWYDDRWADSPQFGRDPALVLWRVCALVVNRLTTHAPDNGVVRCSRPGDVKFVDEWVVDQKCPDRDITAANSKHTELDQGRESC